MTIFVAIMATAIIFVAGLVLDGGRILRTVRLAANLADSAARAGAQEIDEDTVRSGGGAQLDAGAAEARAIQFVATAKPGATAVASVNGTGTEITVTVTIDQPLLILPAATRTISGTGTAEIFVDV